jgi:hypothetical protein
VMMCIATHLRRGLGSPRSLAFFCDCLLFFDLQHNLPLLLLVPVSKEVRLRVDSCESETEYELLFPLLGLMQLSLR